ncbi:MAG: hypothetical protein LBE32_05365 [Burkholderiales bacterium]|nr:hypothetical protein [Burkholderiales bacterium]
MRAPSSGVWLLSGACGEADRELGALVSRKRGTRIQFALRYTNTDVALLAELDSLHDTLSGAVTRELARRACQMCGDTRYERLAHISVSHLYNLRKTRTYRDRRCVWTKTRPNPVAIAVKRAPAPNGLLGDIRIDTVHQGDLNGTKGVYHINAIDIVTQWDVVAAVELISEAFMLPAIVMTLKTFPVRHLWFPLRQWRRIHRSQRCPHTRKVRIGFTRSRPRQTNDNALVECKNGAVVCNIMSYSHIPQRYAATIIQLPLRAFLRASA